MTDSVASASSDSNSTNHASLALLWCFRVVVALQCFGIAGKYVLSANESESDVYGLLFFDLGFEEAFAQSVDDAGAYACLACGLVLILNGVTLALLSRFESNLRLLNVLIRLDVLALIFVAIWSLVLATTHSVRGELYAEFSHGEMAVRFLTPVAMLLYLRSFGDSSHKSPAVIQWLLAFAAAVTFAVHGYKAVELYGPFTDLILLTDQKLFQFEIEQVTAETWLCWIGWADIIVAILLIFTRWRIVAIYMFIWGFVTATSRMTAYGSWAWPETMIRSANWGAPLLLLWLTTMTMKTSGFGIPDSRTEQLRPAGDMGVSS